MSGESQVVHPRTQPPRGWYQDPYSPDDPSRQRLWDGKAWSERTRPTPRSFSTPPDVPGLPPTWLTFVAILLALAGSVMAIPFFVQSWSFSALPGQNYPGWRQTLWTLAFFVGVPSLVLALVSGYREYHRGSRSGRRWAAVAQALAVLGACVWMFPACIQASTGL
jgi:hypothetical protein